MKIRVFVFSKHCTINWFWHAHTFIIYVYIWDTLDMFKSFLAIWSSSIDIHKPLAVILSISHLGIFLTIDEIQTVKMVLNGFNTHTQTLCIIFWNKKTKMQQCHSSYLSNDHNCCECHYNIICRRPLRTDQFYVCFYRVFAFVSALWSFVNRICTMLTILPHLLFINSC